MKKIICIALCLIFVIAAFAGCAEKQLTFEEAASAGKEFIKSEGIKDVKYETEADGTKLILEGKYDHTNDRAVFSVSIDTKDTTQTFKDMLKLNGRDLYIKIPDLSGLDNVFGNIMPAGGTMDFGTSGTEGVEGLINSVEGLGDWEQLLGSYGVGEEKEESEDAGTGLETIGALPGAGYGLTDEIVGKYILVKLPENKPETIKGILSDAEDQMYEKAEKLESEEDYPYVVKYTQQSAYDLVLSVLDGIKEKKSDIAAEISALVAEHLGEENFKSLNELNDKPLSEMISDGIDEFFKKVTPEDIAPEDAEGFEVIQKISYDTGKKLQYVFLYDLKDGENKHNVKSALTVAAAEEDAVFAEKCTPAEDEIFDFAGYLKNLLNTMKSLKSLQNLFN
ncbi:MAG: hypothetical protein IJT49_10160 [Clostridia bacterium]|nr:hypothetical protein [Clostridia bacterium]